jgi:predicted  nucleic acid-binding Zn-ribbon protein
MAKELQRELMQSKNYCTDRLAEVKIELNRLQEEGTSLKADLEAATDSKTASLIRRRRMYLSRRVDELKTERAARTEELQKADEQLKGLPR